MTEDSVEVGDETLYEILGVHELVSQDALTKAYRQTALELHPDKGGDAAHFDSLVKAFKILSVQESRDAYDQELAKVRQRNKLVEGGPAQASASGAGGASKKQAEAPMRQKTEPTAGSKRQGKLRTAEPGKLGHCANEWKGIMSGGNFLKAILDDVTEEEKTERLFQRYAVLPPGKEKKREWTNSLSGKEKADLKALAKQKEQAARAKMNTWIQHGPCGDGKARREMKKAAAAKAKAATAKLVEAAAVPVPEDAELDLQVQ